MPNIVSPVGPVVYAIAVNGDLIPEFPLDIELRQCWGQHELFFIRIEYPRQYTGIPTMKLWKDNDPVQITWGRSPDNIQTWYGYVNHHKVNSNADSGSRALQITYICTGTSKPMNNDKTRTWGQVTPTYIARKIASEYGFRSVLTKTDWILPYEVQSNESDFKFLNRISDKVGYRFWVSGSTLYFIDPTVVLQGSVHEGTPVFYLDKKYTQLDTIRDFSMNRGDNIPGNTIATRSIFGIDDSSNNIYQVNAASNVTADIDYIWQGWSPESADQAQRLVNAWQNRSQFWKHADAELYGTSSLYPGKLIYLTGMQLPAEAIGYWLVKSACHVAKASGTSKTSSDKYITRVEILRNTDTTIPAIKNVSKITPEFIPCNLFQGQWFSENASVLYDGVLSS